MVIRFLPLLLLFTASTALAANGKEEYEKAVKYSKAGEYEAALPLFKKAYEASGKRPSTIVALAQCERSLKLWDDSIRHFKEYLAVKPTPKDAKKIQETIALLEEIRAAQPQPQQQQPQPQPKPAEEPAKTAALTQPPKVELKPQPNPQLDPERKNPPPPIESATPPHSELTATTTPPASEDDSSVLASPVFWIISGVVVLAAGGVAVGVLAGGEPDPYGGTSGIVLTK